MPVQLTTCVIGHVWPHRVGWSTWSVHHSRHTVHWRDVRRARAHHAWRHVGVPRHPGEREIYVILCASGMRHCAATSYLDMSDNQQTCAWWINAGSWGSTGNQPVVHGVCGRVLHGWGIRGLSVHSWWRTHSWAHLGRHIAHVGRHVWTHARPHIGTHVGAIGPCPHLIRRHPSWRHASIWRTSTLACHGIYWAHASPRVAGIRHVAIARLPRIT